MEIKDHSQKINSENKDIVHEKDDTKNIEIKDENIKEIIAEIKAEIKKEIIAEVKAGIKEEIIAEIKAGIKEEVNGEIRNEIIEEKTDEIKDDTGTECVNITQDELEKNNDSQENGNPENNSNTEEEKIKKKKLFSINKWNLLKIFFSIVITIIASIICEEKNYLLFGFVEIALIFFVSDLINKKNNILANIINSILSFVYNFEVGLLIFSNSFLSRIMFTNLDSIEDLSGKAFIYILAAIIVLIFSLLKYKNNDVSIKIDIIILLILITSESFMVLKINDNYSPFVSCFSLIGDEVTRYSLQKKIKNTNVKKEEFYKDGIENAVQANHSLGQNPNIILIFTEGLSQNVIWDNRNIMPNIREYETKSINFTGYYNHTFATYRGLIGQLYSGYQYDNYDNNYLISLQSILHDNGYKTLFINTEPHNKDFTKYLKAFCFDDMFSSKKFLKNLKYTTDKHSYEELFSQAEKLNKGNDPFLICMYTFGTHVSIDSPDEKYGDGNNSLLNRFYNLDYQFNAFMKKFNDSELYDNTIIIFTTDHCTYNDLDFTTTFNNIHERQYTMLDDIPLFIYHKGIEHCDIDVNGRNSLCLAPTILDYIDVSSPNYFLGTSLFSGAQEGSELEYSYGCELNYCSTKNKELMTDHDAFDENIKSLIFDYYSICSE